LSVFLDSELLNNIEYNVEETKGATIAAHQELEIARNHQRSANKKKAFIVIIIVVILYAIIIPILVKFIPKSKPVVHSALGVGFATDTHTGNLSRLIIMRPHHRLNVV
jgi:hypothetical protein